LLIWNKSAAKATLLALCIQKQPNNEQQRLDPNLGSLGIPKQIHPYTPNGVVHTVSLLYYSAWHLQKLAWVHWPQFQAVLVKQHQQNPKRT